MLYSMDLRDDEIQCPCLGRWGQDCSCAGTEIAQCAVDARHRDAVVVAEGEPVCAACAGEVA